MPNRIITKSSPILIKKITSALPTNLFNKLTELNDINSSSLSGTNAYLKYDSASQNFTFVSLSSLGGGLDSAAVNALIAAADTHDSAAVIGQIDSAYVQPLARAAIVAGSNITYDSATGTISSTASGTVDSAAVNTLIAAADTHDSAAVLGQINAKFASNATFSRDLNVDSNLTVGGYIGGPAVFTIDPAAIGDSTGKVIILGDLQVDGTQTTINSTAVSISDKNIVLADSATDASQADGAGITVNGASATLQYAATGDKWVFNKAPYYNTSRLLTTADDLHDSAAVQRQIDSAVNQTLVRSFIDQSFINTFDTHDSAAVVGQIDSAYVRPLARAAFVAGTNITYDSATGVIASTASGGTGTDSATVVSIADSRIGVASIGALSDVDLTGIATNRVLKWNGTKFVAALDATGSGGAGIALTDLGATNTAGKFGSLSYNNVSGVFTYTGPDSADVKTVTNIPYGNLTGTPTIPTVDSATIRPLARAAIVAGTNITYDSATGVIAFTASGGGAHDSALVQGQIDSAVTIAFINSLSGTLDADTLGGNDSSYYLNYNNFTNKPTIPTVDSATIQPLARAAIVAGSNITYDSGTGVIAAVIGDTQDSAAVQGQIDSSINNNIVGTSNEVEVNATGGVATIGLPSAVQITTSLTVGGNAVLTTASDTHDSAAVQGQIDSAAASFLSSDSDDTMSANLTVTGTITTGSGNNTTVIKSDTATYNNYSIKHDLDGTSVTLSSTTVIDTYTHNSAKTSIEYLIHIEHNTSAETQITKILATYKGSGTDVQFTEYGEIFTGDSSLGALTVDENAGSIRLLLDPRGSEDVISKVVRTVII